MGEPLPVDDVLPELISVVRARRAAVLVAPTGAGKTTRVPPALLDAGLVDNAPRGPGMVVMLEPRRVAARAAARRIASERGVRLGGEVGFSVRFDRRASAATRLLVVTEGVLVRMLHEDALLERVGCVVFDEFHERHLDTDLSLAMVRRVREVREDLAVVVMSATLEAEGVAEALGVPDAVVRSEGRLHPVEVSYLPRDRDVRLPVAAASAARRMLNQTDGDVLVFLPGVGEIRRTAEELSGRLGGVDVCELYGDMPAERQDAALRGGERRRVVLSTNVAESSVTIDGVTGVVDCGLARRPRWDPAAGLDRLELVPISRASADQRAGRAGRTAPGHCLRLWGKHEHAGRVARETPEIQRVDLAGAWLQLLCWGEVEPAAVPWLDPPDEAAVSDVEQRLEAFGATRQGALTDLGRRMAALPLAPRLARLLLAGLDAGCADRAALAAALLSDRDPFANPGRGGPSRGLDASAADSASDVVDRVQALEGFGSRGRRGAEGGPGRLDAGGAQRVLATRDQLLRRLERERGGGHGRGSASGAPPIAADQDIALRRALFAAYADRLARRREPGSSRAVMVGRRGVRLDERSSVRTAELFVAVDLGASSGVGQGRGDALVRLASAVEREWLDDDLLVTTVETAFDTEREQVIARRRTRWLDLLLDEGPAALPQDGSVARALAAAAGEDLGRALLLDSSDVIALRARVQFVAEHCPAAGLPRFDDQALRELLPELCAGLRAFSELRRMDLANALKIRLDHVQRRELERLAPERIHVPSGSAVRLTWEPGRPPVLAVRIQEVFGWTGTPRVAGGRVPVLLHLLGPNGRAQQVTDDLASFWANTYAAVRKDLRRRYPRHAWPEDPTSAAPQRRPTRRRKT